MCKASDDTIFLGKSRLANSKSALSLENKSKCRNDFLALGERDKTKNS